MRCEHRTSRSGVGDGVIVAVAAIVDVGMGVGGAGVDGADVGEVVISANDVVVGGRPVLMAGGRIVASGVRVDSATAADEAVVRPGEQAPNRSSIKPMMRRLQRRVAASQRRKFIRGVREPAQP